MDNKKKIIDDFKKKVKLIEKHNEHYFKNDGEWRAKEKESQVPLSLTIREEKEIL